jgi:hypothetical protein
MRGVETLERGGTSLEGIRALEQSGDGACGRAPLMVGSERLLGRSCPWALPALCPFSVVWRYGRDDFRFARVIIPLVRGPLINILDTALTRFFLRRHPRYLVHGEEHAHQHDCVRKGGKDGLVVMMA